MANTKPSKPTKATEKREQSETAQTPKRSTVRKNRPPGSPSTKYTRAF